MGERYYDYYYVWMEWMSGWWLSLPLWKMMEFVSWDDEIPNIWKDIKFMFQTINQMWMGEWDYYIIVK